jgi:hypothetical protein
LIDQNSDIQNKSAVVFIKNQVVWSLSEKNAKEIALKQVRTRLNELVSLGQIQFSNLNIKNFEVTSSSRWLALFRQDGFVFFPDEN